MGIATCCFSAGTKVRGALAGNGEEMAVAIQVLKAKKSSGKKGTTSTTRERSSKPKSRTGSEAAQRAGLEARPEESEEAGGAEEARADGPGQLWEAANRELADNSHAIAKSLAAKAALGNTACAKILVDLMKGKKPAPKRKPGELTDAQRLQRDKPWEGPEDQYYLETGEGGVEPECPVIGD